MKDSMKITWTLIGLAVAFAGLAAAFRSGGFAKTDPLPKIPLVDPALLSAATPRKSFVDLARERADLSDFDCTGCHETGESKALKFDRAGNVIVPQEHANIVMHHGTQNRNNNCYNCHDEKQRDRLTARDGRLLTFWESPRLCGSCHGTTYRDWENGAHGRTSGYWAKEDGDKSRKVCASCHNPHSPKYAGREPLPMPHPLHPLATPDHGAAEGER